MRKYKRTSWLSMAVAGTLALMITAAMATAGDKVNREKGWLGVYLHDIDEETQEAEDLPSTEGVIIDNVMKDSPAEKAGLKSGDVIVKFNGQSVESSAELTRFIRRAAPDTEAKLEIIRDKKPQEVTVVLGKGEGDEISVFNKGKNSYLRALRRRDQIAPLPPLQGFNFFAAESPVRLGVQLHDLNRQLGEYFGIQDGQGALVEEVIKESPAQRAGIKAGDVIVQIADDQVGDIRDVLDDLRDYESGDTVSVTVVRKGAKQNFTVTLAEDDEWSGNRMIPPKPGKPVLPRRSFSWDNDEPDRRLDTTTELRESIRELREELQKTKDELWKALRELQNKKG